MTNGEKYKFCIKAICLFTDNNIKELSKIEYNDDALFIHWKNNKNPVKIYSKSAIEKFKELKGQYKDTEELYKIFYNTCINMLNIDLDKYREDAKKEASINPKIFRICCIDKSGSIKKINLYRSTADLFGMFEDEIIQLCINDVNELRASDDDKNMKWHVLDQDNKIIY